MMNSATVEDGTGDNSNQSRDHYDHLYDLDRPVERDHSWRVCYCYAFGLSLSITIDILQYSMPLAFLPSVLEDRGHSPMKIATAIGVYYWTGFAGGLIITSYQVWRVIKNAPEPKIATLGTVKRQIKLVIVCLGVGSITLICQAMSPRYLVHVACRFAQGFAGAFIFFYTFLLSVSLFKDEQQVFAMTTASTALNVAEVLGSFLGAIIFYLYGQRAVFWFLGLVSVLNQIVLILILRHLTAERELGDPSAPRYTPEVRRSNFRTRSISRDLMTCMQERDGWTRLKDMLQSRRLAYAVILIVMSASVKGSVEEMLPFYTDHQWGFQPLRIGQAFSLVALFYITAAICIGTAWPYLQAVRVSLSALFLTVLGFSAWFVFYIASWDKAERTLWVALAIYGMCLGLTHTPAALLLADAIEHEEGAAKDAVNGIWNTMWEAGGSLGFLLGGLLAHNYEHQKQLVVAYIFCCICCAMLMIVAAIWPAEDPDETLKLRSDDDESSVKYSSNT
eukprot:gnl/TRDRNA2_/TRDRNA2_155134_c0_seq5.p1 gnl/TRDRNA2_/TRDRNA2_155134_c0~~gnl/TRDRNA2_/TRDRNA2_155134_c0_seq5.p1  ORF type:complete len:505 (+),score=60.60 gnl/TRDRNA2_/TRDRNA2_155134_c0_seq5:82-1596(+)